MSKVDPRKTGRSKQDAVHYRLYKWFTACNAWRSLNSVERCVYLEIAQRY